ncbi:ATP-binding protein [Clostridiaceae bacterium 35-E11]
MKKVKKMLLVSLIAGLAAQININLFMPGFKISFGIILFPIFLFTFRDLNTVQTGIITAIMVYLGRVIIYAIGQGNYHEVIWAYFPEILFYGFYGILYAVFSKKNTIFNLNQFFWIVFICDYLSNLIELFIRIHENFYISFLKITPILLLVAMIRSSIVWIVLNGFKYYKMLILKEEHEERYKKLLWLTSRLKTEMYWMEKSMDNIEKVMSNAYQLFEKISLEVEKDTWTSISLEIAKDVHEIKKEYGLVFRGIEEIIDNKLKDKGMSFKEILLILRESMINEMKYRGQAIQLDFVIGNDFFTTKHYYLMSVFRNLVMNAMDAIDSSQKEAKISFIHKENEIEHIFHITDTGCGIKKEDLGFIFSPGFSTKIDYCTGHINRGLGLSLVKNVVEERLKGKIEVDAIEGKGSSFVISIPKEVLEV